MSTTQTSQTVLVTDLGWPIMVGWSDHNRRSSCRQYPHLAGGERTVYDRRPTFLPLQRFLYTVHLIRITGRDHLFDSAWTFSRTSDQHISTTHCLDCVTGLFIPDLLVGFLKPYAGTTPLAVGTLMVMHVATAMICLNILPRLGRANS